MSVIDIVLNYFNTFHGIAEYYFCNYINYNIVKFWTLQSSESVIDVNCILMYVGCNQENTDTMLS